MNLLREKRNNYNELRKKYGIVNEIDDEEIKNEVNDIKKEIKKDIDRLYPTGAIEYFEQDSVREKLTEILIIWGMEHQLFKFRQGMHEVLAPIYYVMERDKLFNCEEMNDDELYEIFDPKYTLHDTFALYSELMKYLSALYENNEIYDHKITDNTLPLILQMCDDIKNTITFYSPELTARFTREQFDITMYYIIYIGLY